MDILEKLQPYEPILFFDGLCNLCHDSVTFIRRYEKAEIIKFCPLQSEIGAEIKALVDQQNGEDTDSILFLNEGKLLTRSDAALAISHYLKYPYNLLSHFVTLPGGVRDGIYDWVARNRYKIWGKKKECPMPDENLKERFITDAVLIA